MPKRSKNPRYRVVSVRVTDEELTVIKKAKAAGFSQEGIRDLLLFGARCCLSTGLPSNSGPLPLPAFHRRAASDHMEAAQ